MWQLEATTFRNVAVVLAGALLGACDSNTIDEAALARQARSLSSIAAEAAFLTRELQAGHLQAAFVSVHLHNLQEDTSSAQQELAKLGTAGVELRKPQTQALAQQLAQSLHRIALAQAGPAEPLESERSTLGRLHSELDAIGQKR
jgi:hypothetical protein